MGRVSVEKRLEEVIEILTKVRTRGFEAKLVIAGGFGDDTYADGIRALVQANADWIITPGFLDPVQKRDLLSRATYALHACEGEAFGIAVGEFVACGCIPFVPSTGGAKELVDSEACRYGSRAEAVEKILRMAQSEVLRRSVSMDQDCIRQKVSPETFSIRIRELVQVCADRARRGSGGQSRVERLAVLRQQLSEAETVELPQARAANKGAGE